MDKKITEIVLLNAIKFNGKASPGAVIGKLIGEFPELKTDMKGLSQKVNKEIQKINSISLSEQESLAKELGVEEHKKEKIERNIFAFLKIADGEKIVTAFPPEPSKYPHIGHAKAILLNYELAKQYNGKFILRFEDTNPTLAKEEFYMIHLEGYEWLGIQPDIIQYASDYIEEFYKFARQLIVNGNAYVCECTQEIIKEKRFKGEECGCINEKNQLEQFEKIFSSPEGKMIVRLRIDMKHKNTSMRNPAILRIIDNEHPRTKNKYRVWPNYDFENSVMDGMFGVTHRLRSKEFEMRNELQRYIQKILGFRETNIYEFARFNLEGVESSGRIIREKIENKELIGWDDPSLTTLSALKRRGFRPEAIKDFVLSTGITKSESTLTWDDLIICNKRILDPTCKRFFFIEEPVDIEIINAPSLDVELKVHPEKPEMGLRKFKTGNQFFVTKKDFNEFSDGKLYRLMDCLNFSKKGEKFIFESVEYEKFKNLGNKIIHWLPKNEDLINVSILMPDKEVKKGICESGAGKLKTSEVIQFERFGFVRFDESKIFWFTHR